MPVVDMWASTNVGSFGLVLPNKFVLATAGKDAAQAVLEVLTLYSFPSLNITYSASAPLTQKKLGDDFKVRGYLKQIEARITIDAGAAADDECAVLGIYPDETNAVKKDPPLQIAPDIGALMTLVNPAIGGVVSALGITLPGLFRPSFPIVSKAFISASRVFGWYVQTQENRQCEGVHYGAAILQVSRKVTSLQVDIELATDWHDLDSVKKLYSCQLKITHPTLPQTPSLIDATSIDALPLTVPCDDVRDLLAVTKAELDQLITDKKLVAFGATHERVSKGSLLALLGLQPQK